MGRRIKSTYYGWWIVAISFAVNTLETGVYYLGFSVFFLPISRDLNVSRAAASLPFSLAKVGTAVTSPFMGLTVDRFGPSRILLLGGLVAGLGYTLLKWSPNYLLFLLIFVLIISPAVQGGLNIPTTVAVSQWFVKKRALALGIASMGFALGGAIITPLVSLMVQNFGWRTAALVVGVLIWAVVLPLSRLARTAPEGQIEKPKAPPPTIAPVPGGQTAPASLAEDPHPPEAYEGFTLRDAVRTPTYWFLAISYGLRGMFGSAISIHLVAMMVWKGIGESTAGVLVGAYPFLWMPAGIIMAWAADKWSKQRIAAVAAFIGALALLLMLLWNTMSIWQMLLLFFLLSPNEGSWPLAWAMLADHFGREHYGLLRGTMMGILNAMAIIPPFYSGWVFDTTQSYFWVILPAAILLGAAGLFNWFMPPATRPRHRIVAPEAPEALAVT